MVRLADRNESCSSSRVAASIPDHLPAETSEHEKRVFSIFQKLPSHCVVYYEPRTGETHPDFIIIIPDYGVITIGVLPWLIDDLADANKQVVVLNTQEGQVRCQHPTAEGREFMYSLAEEARRQPSLRVLLKKEGFQSGRFVMPSGHVTIFPEIASAELAERGRITSWRDIFPENEVATRDTLDAWDALDGEALLAVLKRYIGGNVGVQLSRKQLRAFRVLMHPEIAIGPLAETGEEVDEEALPPLRALDIRQEYHVRSFGGGHRVLYGVAGSGKTLVIMARARLMARAMPQARVLLLCYNPVLAAFMRAQLADLAEQVAVFSFHDWSAHFGVPMEKNMRDRFLGKRLLFSIERMGAKARRYDAIMIDEAHDFSPEWFRCALLTLADPERSDLFIAGDGSQSHYGNSKHNWNWAELGVRAEGRRSPNYLDLDHDYRNTAEILEVASGFMTSSCLVADDVAGACVRVHLDRAPASLGIPPQILQCQHKVHECRKVVQIVRELLSGQWVDQAVPPLKPEEIGIFYPILHDRDVNLIEGLMKDLAEFGVTWIRRVKGKLEGGFLDPGIKIQSISSAKGLEYKAVILMFVDELPRKAPEFTPISESKLMYCGITRAHDFLAATCSNHTPFIDQMIPKETASVKAKPNSANEEIYEWISPLDRK